MAKKQTPKKASKKKKNNLYAQWVTFLSTSCYVGFLPKAPGTWGSLLAVILYLLIFRHYAAGYFSWFIILSFVVGVWATGEHDRIHNKHDASESVIDEVFGQSLVLLPIFFGAFNYLRLEIAVVSAFILFRFFDIVKPAGVNRMQKLPDGWGIMLDDALAAVYAIITLGLVNLLYGFILSNI